MFKWRHPTSSEGPAGAARAAEDAVEAHPSPNLVKAIECALKKDAPKILDLGPLCGETVVVLASRGARVTVDEFRMPAEPPPAAEGEEPPPRPPIRIDQPDDTFDLVLVWEQIDFVAPDRLKEFAAEIRRVTAADGGLLIYSRSKKTGDQDRRGRYRLVTEDRVVREPAEEEPRPRWVHPTRMIEEAFASFSIQGIHLQRDQTREFLATVKQPARGKRGPGIRKGGRKPPRRAPGKARRAGAKSGRRGGDLGTGA